MCATLKFVSFSSSDPNFDKTYEIPAQPQDASVSAATEHIRNAKTSVYSKHISLYQRLSNFYRRLIRGQTFGQWAAEFIKFCLIGGLNYIVDVGLYNILRFGPGQLMRNQYLLAGVISVSVAIVVSWVINRQWTFSGKSQGSRRREFILFLWVNIVGMGIALGCLYVSHAWIGFTSPQADNISKNVVGIVLGMLFRYLMYRYVIFSGDSKSTDSKLKTSSKPV